MSTTGQLDAILKIPGHGHERGFGTVQGVLPHVLRKIAGHGSLTTTQGYLHPDQRSIDDAGTALSAHLKAPRSPTQSQLVGF